MADPETAHRDQADSSAFARAGLLAYGLLIVYASWYPFTGWRDIGVSPLAYLLAPLPRYWTVFDLATNVVGYIPFGMFLVCSLYPRIRGAWAVALSASRLINARPARAPRRNLLGQS